MKNWQKTAAVLAVTASMALTACSGTVAAVKAQRETGEMPNLLQIATSAPMNDEEWAENLSLSAGIMADDLVGTQDFGTGYSAGSYYVGIQNLALTREGMSSPEGLTWIEFDSEAINSNCYPAIKRYTGSPQGDADYAYLVVGDQMLDLGDLGSPGSGSEERRAITNEMLVVMCHEYVASDGVSGRELEVARNALEACGVAADDLSFEETYYYADPVDAMTSEDPTAECGLAYSAVAEATTEEGQAVTVAVTIDSTGFNTSDSIDNIPELYPWPIDYAVMANGYHINILASIDGAVVRDFIDGRYVQQGWTASDEPHDTSLSATPETTSAEANDSSGGEQEADAVSDDLIEAFLNEGGAVNSNAYETPAGAYMGEGGNLSSVFITKEPVYPEATFQVWPSDDGVGCLVDIWDGYSYSTQLAIPGNEAEVEALADHYLLSEYTTYVLGNERTFAIQMINRGLDNPDNPHGPITVDSESYSRRTAVDLIENVDYDSPLTWFFGRHYEMAGHVEFDDGSVLYFNLYISQTGEYRFGNLSQSPDGYGYGDGLRGMGGLQAGIDMSNEPFTIMTNEFEGVPGWQTSDTPL